MVIIFIILTGLFSLGLSAAAPYPPSPVFDGITWDKSSIITTARGSDLWPITWADDDHLYTSYGDGGGFGGSRVSLGVARISGTPENHTGTNLGKDNGKSHGIVSVDGVLYMQVDRQSTWDIGKMGRSTDHGKTWSWSGWNWKPPFQGGTFIQFGKDNQLARDNYVYYYSDKDADSHGGNTPSNTFHLARVPKDKVMSWSAYEFFAGLDGSNNPNWTTDFSKRRPVFEDPNGTAYGMQVMYHSVFKRYIMTKRHSNRPGVGMGIFDAPEPWGPWTTIAYYDIWLVSDRKHTLSFTMKPGWMSADGLNFWAVFSKVDDLNFVKGRFSVKGNVKLGGKTGFLPERNFSIQVRPNPFNKSTILTLKSVFNPAEKVTITIFDINGKTIDRMIVCGQALIQGLHYTPENTAAGIYILKTEIKKRSFKAKLLIQ